jgi:hypothetical protein
MSLLATINKAASELPETEKHIKQWQCKAKVRRLSLAERTKMFEMLSGENNKTNVASLLVAFSLVDVDGKKLHTKTTPMEVYQSLEKGDPEVVNKLFEAADALSAVSLKSVDDLEKN